MNEGKGSKYDDSPFRNMKTDSEAHFLFLLLSQCGSFYWRTVGAAVKPVQSPLLPLVLLSLIFSFPVLQGTSILILSRSALLS